MTNGETTGSPNGGTNAGPNTSAATGLTIEAMTVLGYHDPMIRNFLRRLEAQTYDEFLDVLYDDIKIAIERLEQSPQLYVDESEDATTQRLLDTLYGMSYGTHHNLQLGGNVDITVELFRKGFRWIGEAKKFNSVGDMREGYLQLATRYKPGGGSITTLYGGLIGYLRRPNAVSSVEAWKTHYSDDVAMGSTLSACPRRGALAFISEHAHASIGLPFRVWHLCICLHFEPQDASGRTAKRYQKPATTHVPGTTTTGGP